MESAKERMLALRRWKEEQERKALDEEARKNAVAEEARKAAEEAFARQRAAERAAREAAGRAKEEKRVADREAKKKLEADLLAAAEAARLEQVEIAKEEYALQVKLRKSKPKAVKEKKPSVLSVAGVTENPSKESKKPRAKKVQPAESSN